jgi:hypothetical protein
MISAAACLYACADAGKPKGMAMRLRSTPICFAAFAAALMLVFLAVPAARAFTFDNQSSTNFDGTPKFADPDEAVENFGRGGSTLGQNGPSFQFGVQRSGQSNDWTNPAFQPLGPWSFGNGRN